MSDPFSIDDPFYFDTTGEAPDDFNPFAGEHDFTAQADADEAAAHSTPEPTEPEKPRPMTPAELVDAMTAEDFAQFLQLYVLQKIVNNAVADFTGARKDGMDDVLPLAAKKFSTDQWKVRVPTLDGQDTLIGTVSVKRTKEKTEVTSEIEVVEWLDKNHPDAVYEETIPEKVIPAKTIRKPKVSALADIIEKATITPEGTVVTKDGETIPGVKVIPADQYAGHMTSFGGRGNPQEMKGRDLLLRNQLKGHTVQNVIMQAAIGKGQDA